VSTNTVTCEKIKKIEGSQNEDVLGKNWAKKPLEIFPTSQALVNRIIWWEARSAENGNTFENFVIPANFHCNL
jgi:hypothetical protein